MEFLVPRCAPPLQSLTVLPSKQPSWSRPSITRNDYVKKPVPPLSPALAPLQARKRMRCRPAGLRTPLHGSADDKPTTGGKGLAAGLRVILTISCLNLIGFTAVAPITAGLMEHFGLHSDTSVGYMSSSFALGRFCTTSLWPILSDYCGRKRVLCIALIGNAVGALLQAIIVTSKLPFFAFLAARGLAGMFSGIVPVLKAYIGERFSGDDVPKALAYREAASTIAFVVGPAIGGFLAGLVFAAPLYLSAAAGLLAAVLAIVGLEEVSPSVPRHQSSNGRSATGGSSQSKSGQALPWRRLAPLLTLSFTWACTRTCFHAFSPLLLSRGYALNIGTVGAVLALMSVLVAVVQVQGFEVFRRRFGLRGTLYFSSIMMAFGLLGLGSLQGKVPLALFLIVYAAYCTGVGLFSPALPTFLVQVAPKGQIGVYLGIDSLCVNFGRIVAPPLFGMHGLDYSLRCSALAMGTASAVFLASTRNGQDDDVAKV